MMARVVLPLVLQLVLLCLLFFCFCGAAAKGAAAPARPSIPTTYQTQVSETLLSNGKVVLAGTGLWAQDAGAKEVQDLNIASPAAGKQTTLFRTDLQKLCVDLAAGTFRQCNCSEWTLPAPDNFALLALAKYEKTAACSAPNAGSQCDFWAWHFSGANVSESQTFEVFSSSVNTPAAVVIHNSAPAGTETLTWTFQKFKAAPPPASLFDLPSDCKAAGGSNLVLQRGAAKKESAVDDALMLRRSVVERAQRHFTRA